MRRLLDSRGTGPRCDEITEGRAAKLGEVVCDVLGAGLGIIFAPTRDGGAISITLLDGTEREKGYAGDPGQLDALVEAVSDTATSRRLTGASGR